MARSQRTAAWASCLASSADLDRLDVDLVYASEYEKVDLKSNYLPIHVVGRVKGPEHVGRDIAVAVNGKVVGMGNTFKLVRGDRSELVSVFVPPSSFKQGANDVEVFEVP